MLDEVGPNCTRHDRLSCRASLFARVLRRAGGLPRVRAGHPGCVVETDTGSDPEDRETSMPDSGDGSGQTIAPRHGPLRYVIFLGWVSPAALALWIGSRNALHGRVGLTVVWLGSALLLAVWGIARSRVWTGVSEQLRMDPEKLASERSASEQATIQRYWRRMYWAYGITVLLIVTAGLTLGIAYDADATATAKFQHIAVAIGIVGLAFVVLAGFGVSIYMLMKGVRD